MSKDKVPDNGSAGNPLPRVDKAVILWDSFFERMLPGSDERADAIREFTSRMGVPDEYQEEIRSLLSSGDDDTVHAIYYLVCSSEEWQGSSLRKH